HTAFESAVLVPRQVVVLDMGAGEVEPQTQFAIHCLVCAVDARLIASEAVSYDSAFLLEVVEGGAVLGVGRATREREVMVDGWCIAHHRIFPVRVGRSFPGRRRRG